MATVPDPLPSQYHVMLGKWLSERAGIWQIDLLDAGRLDSFASRRGLMSFFLGDKLRDIWQLGWLRADLVISPITVELPGLIYLEKDDFGQYIYADERVLEVRSTGWANAISELSPVSREIKLLFHPFRYYVLYHINRVLKLHTSQLQVLVTADRYTKLIDQQIEHFQQWSAKPDFVENVASWNLATALAIAAEPCFHERMFGMLRYSFHIGLDEQRHKILEHWTDVAKWYGHIGLERLEQFRRDLCLAAEMLDPNKNVHTMLRLTHGEDRFARTEGRLGGAMCLLTMAETLRRAAEEAFQTTLREEDELGFGVTPHGVKQQLYGSDRIIDADRGVKGQFLRSFGLDYGVRIRWYVEGDTEYWAIDSILGRYTAVELINLRGQVVASLGKGLTFRDNLHNDIKSQAFSLVSIDGDQSSNLRAVRKAAEDDQICGMFFVSTPDFEFANFDLSELEQVLWQLAIESGIDLESNARQLFHAEISEARSSKQLFQAARQISPDLTRLGKGRDWGEKLMSFAWDNPERIDPGTGERKTRPIVEAIEIAVQSVGADYHITRTQMRTDPITGRVVKRSTQSSE